MKLKSIAQYILLTVVLIFIVSGILSDKFFSTNKSTNPACYELEKYRTLINAARPTEDIRKPSYLATKLIFLKTHKTASSTLSGILWHQLCERAKLNCFLPPPNNPGRTWDFESAKDLAYIEKSKGTRGTGPPFDVWLHHARMQDSIYDVVKTEPSIHGDTIQFMSIVRHPALRFRSAWSWYKLSSWFYPSTITFSAFGTLYSLKLGVKPLSLERFAALHPPDCVDRSSVRISTQRNTILEQVMSRYVTYISRHHFKYRTGLDASSEELVGLRRQDPGFESGYGQLLQRVLSGKVLLLVTDRFDESLLVMRKLMLANSHHMSSPITNGTINKNNQTQDPPHAARNNAYKYEYDMPLHQLLYLRQKKQNNVEPLSEATKQKLTHLQPYDTLLYQAANLMLDYYIARLYNGNMTTFHSELGWLRSELSYLEIVCSIKHQQTKQPSLPAYVHSIKQDQKLQYDRNSTKYDLLCEKLKRDNKDLVRHAWDTINGAN